MKSSKLTRTLITAALSIALVTTSLSVLAVLAGRVPPQQAPIADTLPAGIILMWPRDIEDIPPGWALCDGTNGTPNLRDKFVVGAGDDYALGETGGQISVDTLHTHGPGDYSALPSPASIYGAEIGVHVTTRYHEHAHAITGTSAIAGDPEQDNLPPYHALIFIIKLE